MELNYKLYRVRELADGDVTSQLKVVLDAVERASDEIKNDFNL